MEKTLRCVRHSYGGNFIRSYGGRTATIMRENGAIKLEKEMIMKNQNIDQMKETMRAPWIAGNFGAIAKTIGAPDAEGFVARLVLEPDVHVLDIACGTGNVTLPLARRGATVTGLDMTPHLLEEARARAASEGLNIRFDEGFAEALPYPDASFDMVVSMFGIMFSPAPETVASEMARVLRPGGRLALANWTTSGFNGKLPAIVGRYLPPPPPGDISPFLWGGSNGSRAAEAKLRFHRNQCRVHYLGTADRRRRFRCILCAEFWPDPTHARSPRRAEKGRSLGGFGATLDRQQSCRRRPEPYPDPQRVFGSPHLRLLASAANDGFYPERPTCAM